MLFEKYVETESVGLESLIKTSQARADSNPDYVHNFENLYTAIAEDTSIVKKHPLFYWGGVVSPCWRLERAKAWQEHYDRLSGIALECEGKEQYAICKQAQEAARMCMINVLEWKHRLESSRVTVLEPRYVVAQYLRSRAQRLKAVYSMIQHDEDKMKPRRQAALQCYQNQELAYNLWREGHSAAELSRLKEVAHYEESLNVSEFQDQFNHAMQAPSFSVHFESMKTKNEVWKCTAAPCDLPQYSIEQFFGIYTGEQTKK